MKCRTEHDVVELRQLVVDALDEVVFDGRDRQRAAARIGSRHKLVRRISFAIE
jgi:hypothetical protein